MESRLSVVSASNKNCWQAFQGDEHKENGTTQWADCDTFKKQHKLPTGAWENTREIMGHKMESVLGRFW